MSAIPTPRGHELPVPDFYDPAHAEQWEYAPGQESLFERALAWRAAHGLRPAAEDDRKVHMVLVDTQKDFGLRRGALYVGGRSGRGALEDNDRTARFIYRNLAALTDITCTLDTHFPHQVFFSSFWLEGERPPTPHQEVTLADLRGGRLRPNPAVAPGLGIDAAELERRVERYLEGLEERGRYALYLWPPHCLLGSDGHALVGVLHEARLFHAYARVAPSWMEVKGTQPLSENYSAVAPEVEIPQGRQPLPGLRPALAARLAEADAIVVAGQAASHCVKATLEDLLGVLPERLIKRVYVLRDCMSSVAVPDATRPGEFLFDFTPQAEAALERFRAAGMKIVDSTLPVTAWPEQG
ncbi:MAG: nicotinamidase [Gemmatimonadota bacterium]